MSWSVCLHTVCMQNSKASSLMQSQYCLLLQSFVMSLIDSTLGLHHIPANAPCSLLHSSQIMWLAHSVFCYYLLLVSRYRTGCHGQRVDTGRWADGPHLDRTGRLCLSASHWIVWKTSSILFLIAQRTAISNHSIWTCYSTVVILHTFCLCVKHVVTLLCM